MTQQDSTTPDKVLALLVKGRAYFATHEWNRDGTYLRGSACCGVGAVFAAVGIDNRGTFYDATGVFPVDIHDALYSALTAEQRSGVSTFYGFNDHVAKSKDDILAVYDRAIEARKSAVTA